MRRVIFGAGFVVSTIGAAACSPPADPIAKGSASYKIEVPTSGEGTCNLTGVAGIGSDEPEEAGGDTGVPDLPSAGLNDPSGISSFGAEVVDGGSTSTGKGEYTVECTVKKSKGEYDITVEMAGPNSHELAPTSNTGVTRLKVRGTINEETGEGTGTVTPHTTNTSSVAPTTENSCTLVAIPERDDMTAFQIDKGEARFIFNCPSGKSPLDQFGTCETFGTVSVRDCLTD